MPAPKGHAPYAGCETGGRPRVWTDELIEQEAELLIEWAHKETSIVMGKHYGERGYTRQSSCEWAVRNKYYAHAKNLALTIVGARREEMALMGAIDHNIVKTSMGLYDHEYRQYQIDLKSTDEMRREAESSSIIEKICESIENKKNPVKRNEGDL